MRKFQCSIRHGISRRRFTQGALVVFLFAVFQLASSAEANAQNFCSNTSKAAFNACRFEAKDDYWIAVGKCNNVTDIATCLLNAEVERQSKREECAEQLDARQEICSVLGQAPYNPVINPADFPTSTTINNQYFPLAPDTTFVYQGGDEIIVVEVTNETKEILGVMCVVVRDRAYVGGTWNDAANVVVGAELIEDTLDYYAQDGAGNVWYFGEIAQEFEDGDLVSLAGSWKAGVDGAKAGIIMLADPRVGDFYRQEFLLGEAEDVAEVLSLGDTVTGVFSCPYSDTVTTKDFTPIEPDTVENKIYASGVGLVKEFDVDNPTEPVELIDMFVSP